MTSRKALIIAAGLTGVAMLAGCADYPYYDNYAYDNYNYRTYPSYPYYRDSPGYWYGPAYYAAPSVGFGVTYSSRPYYYRGRWYG